jgi:hypothetical protein
MIELLSRNEILKLNKTFASFIIEWQDQEYNPSLKHNRFNAGTMYDMRLNKLRYYSQEEVDSINEERLQIFNREKDNTDTASIEENYTATLVYNFPYAPIENYAENLAKGLVMLAERLNWESTIFLLVYPTPWFSQENDHEPVKKAFDYLRKIGVTDIFNGGFKANGKGLEELLKHLFWITRCNASLPHCFFSGIKKDLIGSICQYGNIHLHFYSAAEFAKTKIASVDLGLIEIKRCFENFSENGAIQGRRLDSGKQITKQTTKPWWKFW